MQSVARSCLHCFRRGVPASLSTRLRGCNLHSVAEARVPTYPGHIPLTPFENGFLAVGSALMAFIDPRRGGMFINIDTKRCLYVYRHGRSVWRNNCRVHVDQFAGCDAGFPRGSENSQGPSACELNDSGPQVVVELAGQHIWQGVRQMAAGLQN